MLGVLRKKADRVLDFWKGSFGYEYTIRNSFSEEISNRRKDSFVVILQDCCHIRNIIEIGSGSGMNMEALYQLGYSVVGVEPNRYAREGGIFNDGGIFNRFKNERKKTEWNVVDGDCYNIPYGDNTFDLVVKEVNPLKQGLKQN